MHRITLVQGKAVMRVCFPREMRALVLCRSTFAHIEVFIDTAPMARAGASKQHVYGPGKYFNTFN